jgi:predicted RNA-binding protein with EMAP domain
LAKQKSKSRFNKVLSPESYKYAKETAESETRESGLRISKSVLHKIQQNIQLMTSETCLQKEKIKMLEQELLNKEKNEQDYKSSFLQYEAKVRELQEKISKMKQSDFEMQNKSIMEWKQEVRSRELELYREKLYIKKLTAMLENGKEEIDVLTSKLKVAMKKIIQMDEENKSLKGLISCLDEKDQLLNLFNIQ